MATVCKVGRPYLENKPDGKTRLCSRISFDGQEQVIWLEVEDRYAQYLCTERSDAFLVGLLPFAYRKQFDLEFEAPVHERLLFQIRSYLLPLIVKYGKSVYPVNIAAESDDVRLSSKEAVGTGISCGIDSLHVIKKHLHSSYANLKLTHLVLNNVGSFGATGRSNQFEWATDQARRFSEETGLELVIINSNIFDWFNSLGFDFAQNCTYLNAFPMFALQKLWSVYLYGSAGDDFAKYFSLINNDQRCAENYDLVILDSFSIPSLRIYSEGLPYKRIEKLEALLDDDFAHRYLNVCVNGSGGNCGHCFKCNRTLLMLDALGALDKFSRVFDISHYKKNRHWYLRYLYRCHVRNHDSMLGEVYEMIGKDVSVLDKVIVFFTMVKNYLSRRKNEKPF